MDQQRYPNHLNYPVLPKPQGRATEFYFISTLQNVKITFEGVPDLACQMLIKIADMLLACVIEFHKCIEHKAIWRHFLEGQEMLHWDLHERASLNNLMGVYARCQFLKAHHMVTFEEAFVIGFFDYKSHIFGPYVQDLGVRYIAYHRQDQKYPISDMVYNAEMERRFRS